MLYQISRLLEKEDMLFVNSQPSPWVSSSFHFFIVSIFYFNCYKIDKLRRDLFNQRIPYGVKNLFLMEQRSYSVSISDNAQAFHEKNVIFQLITLSSQVSRIMDVEGDSPYDILGLNRNLSIENIKKRYDSELLKYYNFLVSRNIATS